MKKARFIGGAILFGAGAIILFPLIVMWLWNWLMPVIFGLGIISWWQAAGLLLLSKILFSSGHGSGKRWHSERRKKFWHSKYEEKWKRVPEEKKAEFARKMEEKGFCKNPNSSDKESENHEK